MKKPWLAALLNFFLMGAGTAYLGRRLAFGLALTAGAVLLTYVELSVKPLDATLYWLMFGAVFVMNTFFAVDALREAKEINARA
jgi:hypothetical protein